MINIERLYLNGSRIESGWPGGNLSGPLPVAWRTMGKLFDIVLNDNRGLSGTFPPEWSEMSSMRHFTLEVHGVGGPIPASWEAWAPNLMQFQVRGASSTGKATGPVPGWLLDQRSPGMVSLFASYNHFTSFDGITTSDVTKNTIQVFDFAYNRIVDNFPNFAKRYNRIQLFYFQGPENILTGPIDDDFFVGWDRLRGWDTTSSPIGGALPSSFGNSSSTATTQQVRFINCQFISKIPASWANYRSNGMLRFYMNSNNLYGEVPSGIADWRTQTPVNISVNSSTNTINHANNSSFNGQRVYFEATGSMPTGLFANQRYFVRDRTSSSYRVSNTLNGPVVEMSTDGSGVRVRHNSYTLTSAGLPGDGLHIHDNRFTYKDLVGIVSNWRHDLKLRYGNQKPFYINRPDQQYINTNQNFPTGGEIILDLSAIDTSGNVYQWQKLSGSTWGNVSGQTTHTLSIANAQPGDSGEYRLRITNTNFPGHLNDAGQTGSTMSESVSETITVTVS
jgi:hypothetical protein